MVSILKPMKSLDDEFRVNLHSFMLLDYPRYEVIFGIDSPDDSCAREAKELQRKYPAVPQKVVVTGVEKRQNPKVATLEKMAPHACGELFWVSDANTRVQPGVLKRLVHEHRVNGTAIVFSPLRGAGSETIGSMIENSYINTFVSGSVLAGWYLLKKPIIVGKSMLINKGALDRLGGFAAFRRYLAEDYLMGRIFAEKGYRVATNATWVDAVSARASVYDAFSRILRWSKMRRTIDPLAFALEIFTNPLAVSLCVIVLAPSHAAAVIAGTFALVMVLEYASLLRVNPGDVARNPVILLLCPAAILLKSALCAAAYVVPFFSTRTSWRGRTVLIGRDSVIAGGTEK
jgi:ceramide glucosyltransferase